MRQGSEFLGRSQRLPIPPSLVQVANVPDLARLRDDRRSTWPPWPDSGWSRPDKLCYGVGGRS